MILGVWDAGVSHVTAWADEARTACACISAYSVVALAVHTSRVDHLGATLINVVETLRSLEACAIAIAFKAVHTVETSAVVGAAVDGTLVNIRLATTPLEAFDAKALEATNLTSARGAVHAWVLLAVVNLLLA